MAFTTAEGRQQILDAIGDAGVQLAFAISALSAAYDALDERTGDRLEAELFGPVQKASGRLLRTGTAFAGRIGMEATPVDLAREPPANRPVPGLVADAVSAATGADEILAELQDSMMPVEVGDRELRDGLAEVRTALGGITGHARELLRVLGR